MTKICSGKSPTDFQFFGRNAEFFRKFFCQGAPRPFRASRAVLLGRSCSALGLPGPARQGPKIFFFFLLGFSLFRILNGLHILRFKGLYSLEMLLTRTFHMSLGHWMSVVLGRELIYPSESEMSFVRERGRFLVSISLTIFMSMLIFGLRTFRTLILRSYKPSSWLWTTYSLSHRSVVTTSHPFIGSCFNIAAASRPLLDHWFQEPLGWILYISPDILSHY